MLREFSRAAHVRLSGLQCMRRCIWGKWGLRDVSCETGRHATLQWPDPAHHGADDAVSERGLWRNPQTVRPLGSDPDVCLCRPLVPVHRTRMARAPRAPHANETERALWITWGVAKTSAIEARCGNRPRGQRLRSRSLDIYSLAGLGSSFLHAASLGERMDCVRRA